MDATCTIQDSIHVFSLVHKYVSRILGTYQFSSDFIKLSTLRSSYEHKYNFFKFRREDGHGADI